MSAKSIFSKYQTPAYTVFDGNAPADDLKTTDSSASSPLPDSEFLGQASIGEGVHMKGEIRDCRQVDVHGFMEGEIEAEIVIIHEEA